MKHNKRYRGAIIAALTGISALMMWGCHKKDNAPFTYSISNIHDTSIEQGKNGVLYFKIDKLSGTAQYVTDSVADIYSGIHATVAPSRALAPFTSAVGFMIGDNVTPATYDYIITTATDGQADQTYTTHITVLDCIQAKTGSYTVTSTCDVVNHSSIVSENVNSFHRINISNFANYGSAVYADVVCSRDSVSIPAQPFFTPNGSYTITGTGDTKIRNRMTINYKLTNADTVITCQEDYSKP